MAAAAETYIGSVISLTSKSEIRYEGVLYTINTEESSIGLRNVRSFGSEGRKKDGQQIPASDKIYEYILFRGSDIKDLQVKSSPPAQPASLHNDPAIIQSHYPRPTSVSTSLPPAASTTAADQAAQNGQSGIQMSPPFQGSLPPTSQSIQSGIQMPPPFQGNLPPTSQSVQPGIQMPPPFQGNLPPTSQNARPGIQMHVQSGIQMPPPFQGNLPPTSQNVQPGIQMPPPFPGNLPPSLQNGQPGIQIPPPFQVNLPPTSQNVQSGIQMPPPFQGNLPPTSQNVQSGIQMPPPFQGNPFQPPPSLPSWNSSPMASSVNGSGLAMPPMYWPGYYTPPTGFAHLQQPTFLRPPHGLAVPQALQQSYPGLNASLPAGFPSMPDFPSLLQPSNIQSQTLGVSAVPASSSASATETQVSQLPTIPSAVPASVISLGLTPPSVSPSTSMIEPSISVSQGMPSTVNNKPVVLPDSSVASLSSDKPGSVHASVSTYQPSQAPSANIASGVISGAESIALVSPGQLLPTNSSTSSQTVQTTAVAPPSKPPSLVSSSQTASIDPSSHPASSAVSRQKVSSAAVPSSRQVEPRNENKEAKQTEQKAKQHVIAPSENKEPLLPAPKPILQKPAGASSYAQYNNRERGRGRGRGRANVQSRPVAKFAEDFDFMAMNEKFNKDEVWGHLGKSNGQFSDDPNEYEDNGLEDDVVSPGKPEVKPLYVKDDFFDSLSSNTIDNGARNGRIKFSEQRKIDTETFGDSARHRSMGMRGGGRGGPRGGGPRGRGGYYGRGYGYTGRGRGYFYPNQQP
ncbi:hypothetical protein QYE76_029659 [Lolium multiflorum]|uniref:Protein decapping 5 n=1 Tax=Lolium multiflorum TaxID=4521 RepID=A0AAD8QN80_LOLMU|nr:hypothetical protein QYE76_029659 [Lolium multiflorum]